MLFNTPLSVGYGNGIGTPAGFAFATVILTIFSVGYVAMARKVTAAGGFYSFISHGLGRELGMAAGLAMVVAYSVFEASLCGGFAYFASLKAAQYGYNIEWYWLALFMVALIGVLALLRRAHLGALLGVALISEVVFLLIFDVAGLRPGRREHPGGGDQPGQRVQEHAGIRQRWHRLAAGAWAVGVFFAFWSWVGFEMAPNYGEESKNPKKIVPMAMYISVIGLGIFYTVTSWAAISGYAPTEAAARRQAVNNAARVLPRPGQAVREHVPPERPELADHHRARSPAAWRSTTRPRGTCTRSAVRRCCRTSSAARTRSTRARTSPR